MKSMTLKTEDLQDMLNGKQIEYDDENEAFFLSGSGYSVIPENFWVNTDYDPQNGADSWLLMHEESEVFYLEFHN